MYYDILSSIKYHIGSDDQSTDCDICTHRVTAAAGLHFVTAAVAVTFPDPVPMTFEVQEAVLAAPAFGTVLSGHVGSTHGVAVRVALLNKRGLGLAELGWGWG